MSFVPTDEARAVVASWPPMPPEVARKLAALAVAAAKRREAAAAAGKREAWGDTYAALTKVRERVLVDHVTWDDPHEALTLAEYLRAEAAAEATSVTSPGAADSTPSPSSTCPSRPSPSRR